MGTHVGVVAIIVYVVMMLVFLSVVLCAIGLLFIVVFSISLCHCRASGDGIISGISFISVKTGIIVFDNDVVIGFILQFVSFVGDGDYKEGCCCSGGVASIFVGVMCRWLL